MIGRVLATELVRLLEIHKPYLVKDPNHVPDQSIIILPELSSGRVGLGCHPRILVNERSANVIVSLELDAEDMVRFVLVKYVIPFADPKCIPKVVEIIENNGLQKRFIEEYVKNPESQALGALFKLALDSWIEEKCIVIKPKSEIA